MSGENFTFFSKTNSGKGFLEINTNRGPAITQHDTSPCIRRFVINGYNYALMVLMNLGCAVRYIIQLIDAMEEQPAMAQLHEHGKRRVVAGVSARPEAIVLKDLSELTGWQCLIN